MSWPASLTVGALVAIVAGALAGLVAGLITDWHRMSSFEGASGYFVVGMILLGAIAGFLLGVVTSRLLGDASMLKALGVAVTITCAIAAVVAGISRSQADIPPTIDGESLVLAIELKWPSGRVPVTTGNGVEPFVRLSALQGNTVRMSQEGPLWFEDAREEDAHWIVPGAVDLFTGRGRRLLRVDPDTLLGEGFEVPLPSRPGPEQFAWSAWLPASRTADQFQFRYRVVPASAPLRVEQVGPFEIATHGGGFQRMNAPGSSPTWRSSARFAVTHGGAPGSAPETLMATSVAVIAGAEPVLLATLDDGQVVLLRDVAGRLQPETIATDGAELLAMPIPDDIDVDTAAGHRVPHRGGVDRTTFAVPGAYLLRGVILDTRTLSVRPVPTDGLGDVIQRIPPLGMAPDGLAFARLAWRDQGGGTAVVVIDLDGGAPLTIPIDRRTMRYGEIDQIDHAWFIHHFAWTRDASGRDRLVARAGVMPLPYRGVLTEDGTGYREYRVAPAGPGLRPMLERFLIEAFGAVPGDTDPAAFAHTLTIGGAPVHVSYRAEDAHVGVWMDRGTDTGPVVTIAERFDRELQGGRYDEAFVP